MFNPPTHVVFQVPCFQYNDIDAFTASSPYAAQLVGIEMDPRAVPLHDFVHPVGVPSCTLRMCNR